VQPSGVVVNFAEKGRDFLYHKYYQHIQDYDPLDPAVEEQDAKMVNGLEMSEKPITINEQRNDGQTPASGDAEEINQEMSQGKDPLQKIHGIGPAFEKALNEIGIMTFAQLAESVPEHIAKRKRINGRLSSKQIRRDGWIEQAQSFVKQANHE